MTGGTSAGAPRAECVDAALDTAGKGSVPDLVALTGDPGRVVTTADSGAAELGVQVSSGGGDRTARLREISDLLAQGRLSTPIAGTCSLDQAAEGYRASRDGHAPGKLVVLPQG